jgi:2-oxoisovalerate dehydrogenase E2 component (dihydrolipoyl transacylase)
MARYEFKLPDIGEGIAEAEIVAWHVKVGDSVEEDQQLADMMTDKATVEMDMNRARSGSGRRGRRHVPIGSVLVVIETEGAAAAPPVTTEEGRGRWILKLRRPALVHEDDSGRAARDDERRRRGTARGEARGPTAARANGVRTPRAGVERRPGAGLAAARQRAISASTRGEMCRRSRPPCDLDAFLLYNGAGVRRAGRGGGRDIKVVGLRRKIAENMQEAASDSALPRSRL